MDLKSEGERERSETCQHLKRSAEQGAITAVPEEQRSCAVWEPRGTSDNLRESRELQNSNAHYDCCFPPCILVMSHVLCSSRGFGSTNVSPFNCVMFPISGTKSTSRLHKKRHVSVFIKITEIIILYCGAMGVFFRPALTIASCHAFHGRLPQQYKSREMMNDICGPNQPAVREYQVGSSLFKLTRSLAHYANDRNSGVHQLSCNGQNHSLPW